MAPPILWCDNLSAQALASNPIHHARTRHIEIDVHFIRDLVTSNKLDVRYISTLHQLADIFTKTLSANYFSFLCSKLNLESFQFILRGLVEKLLESKKLLDSAYAAAVYATSEIHPILTHVTASNMWCEVMQSV